MTGLVEKYSARDGPEFKVAPKVFKFLVPTIEIILGIGERIE
jgi:hypothetical protein